MSIRSGSEEQWIPRPSSRSAGSLTLFALPGSAERGND
jgi:hypothetical protein